MTGRLTEIVSIAETPGAGQGEQSRVVLADQRATSSVCSETLMP